ncbi:uncharacterized protein LOC141679745 [Apium graveolens]|uniref:uncharacterized protein LOC141679745 n=1 Tax=Apium graveolens TaxID=4045 RepID=UPI003D7B78C1
MVPYDGTSEPLEHIAQYKQRMFTVPITRDLKEACMCKGRVFEKTTSDLCKIVQLSREPLRDYLTRFNRENVTIINCDFPTAIEAFRTGLERESPLYEELTKYPYRTMDDVQAKAMAQKREECSDWRKDPNLPPTYDSYGFTITPSAMMKEFTKLGGIVKWPIKRNKPKTNLDSKLWCDYHGDYGHKAYDCVALRKELQFLTRKGYLTEFMASKKMSHVGTDVSPRRNNMTPLRQPPPPPHHEGQRYVDQHIHKLKERPEK